ncbi:permease [Candidatus Haliotispira prima]|uniref:Permease n=1 Tax=Candidatus Haliotispira prima TaxID=3034016 RepID=A0ABY8MJG2_9SPIO|nr:permease [Candidatus Haliotispira prima]
MRRRPSCCHIEEENPKASSCHGDEGHADARHKRHFDTLFWGSLVGVTMLFLLGVFLPKEIAAYPWLEIMAHMVHRMVYAMWWGVAIGTVFVGLLSKIPREFIMSMLGQGGTISGLIRATGAGVLLDLCSHGILMVAAKLYERGASAGQVIAFLLASPWNSFSLTLVLIGLIGWKWTVAFIALSMAIGLITGRIFDGLVARQILPANHNQVSLPDNFQFRAEAKTRIKNTRFDFNFFKEMLISGIKDSKMVVRWLLFGILLAAVLRAALDPSRFEQFFGPTFIGLAITVFVATVLEVCSEGSTPIAADILTRAKAPGNGFAFLMAGVATDYTEIMILKDVTKSRKLAFFLPLITVPQVLLVAWLINIYG